jgi:ribosome modulation factor
MNTDTQQARSDIEEENEKLRLENMHLKRSLEKEEFLHKTLYRQWNELNLRRLADNRESKQVESWNLFYKYAFYLILFLLIPALYFLSKGKADNGTTAPQTLSSPAATTNQTPAINKDTVQPINVKPDKKTIQPVIQSKPATINQAVIEKPLTDSVRTSIYWEGWSAYYEKSHNPYQKSFQKSEVWLEGWKEGEKDALKNENKSSEIPDQRSTGKP